MSATDRSLTVACLAGDGVGPELMGEASRVLAAVARLHALHIDDVHLPFGGEALTRFGHPLPLSTREAYRDADAILVSSPDDPARRRRHGRPRSRLARLARAQPAARRPDRRRAGRPGSGRARDRARVRDRRGARARGSPPSAARTNGTSSSPPQADRWDGLGVELPDAARRAHAVPRPPRDGRPRRRARPLRRRDRGCGRAPRRAACTRSRAAGSRSAAPGLFAAEVLRRQRGRRLRRRGCRPEPCSPLRCCSREGLGHRSAARTLERAVGLPQKHHGHSTDTRSFTDAVIGALPDARTDTELFEEVWR